jgi:hypothetical protein
MADRRDGAIDVGPDEMARAVFRHDGLCRKRRRAAQQRRQYVALQPSVGQDPSTATTYWQASTSATAIADDSVTNAKLANMAASTIKARKTAGTGDPEDCTLSEILDFIGSAAQGDILYRGASAWSRLAAGSTGQILVARGAAAPEWTTASLAISAFEVAQAADLVIASNATYQDTDLLVSLTAGTYAVDVYAYSACNTIPDMAHRLYFTGTVTRYVSQSNLNNTATNTAVMIASATHPYEWTHTATAEFMTLITATIVVSTSGTLSVQVKQVASSVTSITFKAGSRMSVRRVA